jgi:hypothetical protein
MSGLFDSGEQTTSSTQTNAPQWALDAYQKNTERAQTEANKGYQADPGEQVAGFTPEQQRIQQQYAGLGPQAGFQQGQQGLQYGTALGYGGAGSGLNLAMNYNPATTTAQNINASQFTPYAAQQYGNPYQQNVTDTALRQAQRTGDQNKANLSMQAAGRGTFGGARQALSAATNQDMLNRQLSDIQYGGAREGYNTSFNQYTQDQARAQEAAKANQAANLEAQKATQQGEQFRANLGKDIFTTGIGAGLQGSTGQVSAATAAQTADLERLKAQAGSAAEQQMYQQKINDINHAQFIAGRDWGKTQTDWMANQLAGTKGLTGTGTQTSPTASPFSQLAGAGIAAYGMMGSDRRLKKDIHLIGKHPNGLNIYSWTYIWGVPSMGVMADEVEEVMPEAVGIDPSGFKMVNYAMLGL